MMSARCIESRCVRMLITVVLSHPNPLNALWRAMASSRGDVSTGGTLRLAMDRRLGCSFLFFFFSVG
jgi:hypothetical protein